MMGWWGLGFVFFILFWVAVIWFIVWIVRRATGKAVLYGHGHKERP